MKNLLIISILLFTLIACTKKESAKLATPITTQSTNKLLDKTWYIYSRNSNVINDKSVIRIYQTDGQLITDNGNTYYITTDYTHFKYQNSGQFVNDTITFLSDSVVIFKSWQPLMGFYNDTYKLK